MLLRVDSSTVCQVESNLLFNAVQLTKSAWLFHSKQNQYKQLLTFIFHKID